jgi:hypothetical protein
MPRLKKPSQDMLDMIQRAGSKDHEVAVAGQFELAKALTLPLRKGVLNGDILDSIYEPIFFQPGTAVEFPLDFLSPGTEKEFIAYTIPGQGRIPERHVEGDFVMVPTYEVGSSIDCATKYLRDGRWDILGRMLQVLEASFVRKMNDDGWRTLLAAGTGRGLVVFDDAAAAGLFTKRLVALMRTIMRRNAGGNSTSLNRGVLTDIYLSPEAVEDVRSWDLTQIDDVTRREIYLNANGVTKIFGVRLHDLDELGVGQVYQRYYTNVLSGTLPGGKTETVVGLDLSKSDSFIMPVRAEIEIYEDTQFHRSRRAGFYGWGEHGFTVLDNRRTLIGCL